MAQQWFVDRQGRSEGPLTAKELRRRAAEGRLAPSDRVSNDGRRWVAASKVKGLPFRPEAADLAATAAVSARAGDTERLAGAVTVPGYEVGPEIGAGACGVVYRAKQLRLNRDVALKTIPVGGGIGRNALARFEREAVALAKLQHPNVVNVFDFGHHDGRVYMAMELLDGEDLERRIRRLGRLDERTAWTVARQAAAALAHAAHAGVTHRDIKPANLFLVPPATGFSLPAGLPMVKVTDFGLAFTKEAGLADGGDRLTQTGVVVGTPAYMAPEQFSAGDVDHRADIYALGATVYHCLAGRTPFDGLTVWEVMTRKAESVPALAGVSPESARLAADMLATDAGRRVAGYDELIRRIDELPVMRDAPADLPAPPRRPRRRSKWAALGAAAALAVAAATAVILLLPSGPRAADGPAPEVTASGKFEVLSDRADFSSWMIVGGATWEADEEGTTVLDFSGSVKWSFRPGDADRLSVGVDPHRAETVDFFFAGLPDGGELGLRVSRTEGVAAGAFDGVKFRPLTPSAAYPSAASREGLVPYLSVRVQHVRGRWDVWFDRKHVGGVLSKEAAGGYLRIQPDGRAVRVERVELERLRPAG